MPDLGGQQVYLWFSGIWTGLAAVCLIVLFFIPAPYGRYVRKGFGPLVDGRAGWIVMESPAVWVMAAFFALGQGTAHPVMIVFFAMWQVHYLYRSYLFPFRMRGQKKKMTLVTVGLGTVFNLGNGYLNGYYLFGLADPYPVDWLLGVRFLLGAALFAVGLGVHVHSDAILRNLRAQGESGYQIPTGGMFEHVSGANYFGELVQWAGWALATWSPGGLVFFIWTASNLVPRAWSHHKWYTATFPDYPQQRKALIPFVL